MSRRTLLAFVVVAVIAVAGCATDDEAVDTTVATTTTDTTDGTPEDARAPESGCADVVDVELELTGDGSYRISATIRSSDTGNEKYADAWEVRAPDGSVLGTRVLAHPHVGEQPFTRSLDGVAIPGGTERVEIAARDSVQGFCGETMTAALPEG
jgi:hypothetical protein